MGGRKNRLDHKNNCTHHQNNKIPSPSLHHTYPLGALEHACSNYHQQMSLSHHTTHYHIQAAGRQRGGMVGMYPTRPETLRWGIEKAKACFKYSIKKIFSSRYIYSVMHAEPHKAHRKEGSMKVENI